MGSRFDSRMSIISPGGAALHGSWRLKSTARFMQQLRLFPRRVTRPPPALRSHTDPLLHSGVTQTPSCTQVSH